MSSLCDTCAMRTKEIVFTGLSTVGWTGKYCCGTFSNEALDKVVECGRYVPRNRGQMTLEAFLCS